MRKVVYDRLGGPEVLRVADVAPPDVGPGQVRVRVRVAGLNPLDAKVFRGAPTARPVGVVFPAGNGLDFAGVVDEVGEDVKTFAPAEPVLGERQFAAQADLVVVDANELLARPPGLSEDVAGALSVAGRTAWASVNAVSLTQGDTVLVSAAAGGVGILAAQLALRTGARVIGTASPANHTFLRSLGIEPVEYRDDLVAAVREIAPAGITAALDNHGRASVLAALELGAPPTRVNSIADYSAGSDFGTGMVGGVDAPLAALAEVARLLAAGDIVLPIAARYPLEQVVDAYEALLRGHTRGKIVLTLD